MQLTTLFVRKILMFAVLQLLLAGIWLTTYNRDANSYMAASIDKHRVALKIGSPKVLLAGGSSVAWGTDSGLIHARVGLPVVNLAYHAGQGLDYRINEIEAYVGRGDIVVLSLEYVDLVGNPPLGKVVWQTIEADLTNTRFLRWPEWKSLLDDGFTGGLRDMILRSIDRLQNGTWSSSQLPYSRLTFNDYGDAIGHYDLPRQGFSPEEILVTSTDSSDVAAVREKLNGMAERLRRKGVRVLWFYPAVPEQLFRSEAEQIEAVRRTLEDGFQLVVLNTPGEMRYPDEDFFNTPYHLVGRAVERRTSLLGDRLLSRLGDDQSITMRSPRPHD